MANSFGKSYSKRPASQALPLTKPYFGFKHQNKLHTPNLPRALKANTCACTVPTHAGFDTCPRLHRLYLFDRTEIVEISIISSHWVCVCDYECMNVPDFAKVSAQVMLFRKKCCRKTQCWPLSVHRHQMASVNQVPAMSRTDEG